MIAERNSCQVFLEMPPSFEAHLALINFGKLKINKHVQKHITPFFNTPYNVFLILSLYLE